MSAAALVAADPAAAWDLLLDAPRWAPLAPHVVAVQQRGPSETVWDVHLNGSRCSWVQVEDSSVPGQLSFTQTDGVVERLDGRWLLRATAQTVELSLELDFTLGIDGLAPLLDPIWSQSFQAHADALVCAVVQACAARPVRKAIR